MNTLLKAVIIDDEENARLFLQKTLQEQFPHIQILGIGDDVDSGIALIKEQKPNLVFLDVNMPQGTGFDLLAKLGGADFEVVFVTAHDEFALKALQFSAMGYLLKPIRLSELKQTIERLEQRIARLSEDSEKRMRVLIENYGDEAGAMKKIVVANMEGFRVLNLTEILLLRGDRNYTHFFLMDGKKVTAARTLSEYESLLDEFGFFRSHQSYLINLRHVSGYQKGDGGGVLMTNGQLVPLAKQRKANFFERFVR